MACTRGPSDPVCGLPDKNGWSCCGGAAAAAFVEPPDSGTIELQFDPKVRLECMRLAVAGLGPSAPIRMLLLGAEQIEQYVRFGNLPAMVPQDDGEKS